MSIKENARDKTEEDILMNPVDGILPILSKALWLMVGSVCVHIAPECWSQDIPKSHITDTFYLVIGNIKDITLVKFPVTSEMVSDNEQQREIRVYAPPSLNKFRFSQSEIYIITDGIATKASPEKNIVLLADRFFKVKSDDKRHLFFAQKYVPEGEFPENNDLKDCLVLKLMKDKRYALEEGTRAFDLELKKHGITLPQQNESENGSMPDLPGN